MKDWTMKLITILLLSSATIAAISADPCSPNPVAEGSDLTLTKYVDKDGEANRRLIWGFDAGGQAGILTLTSCRPDVTPQQQSSLDLDRYSCAVEDFNSNQYKWTMTIHNVDRSLSQRTWSWYDGTSQLGECDFNVFSFPSAPDCTNIKLSSNGQNVVWTCDVNNVYPEIDCRFEYKKGSGTWKSVTSGYINSKKTTDEGNDSPRTVYYNYECELNLPINQLDGAGNYEFRFTAYMDLTDLGWDDSRTKTAGPTGLNLVLPEVEMINCPNDGDYIKEGDTTRTCQCHLKEVGKPTGVPQWLNSKGNLVVTAINNGNTLSLPVIYNPNDKSPSYTCRGYSNLGAGNSFIYTPTFAYGPSGIIVTLHDNKEPATMNKCESTSSFAMYCDAAIVNVNPRPTMTVTASDRSVITQGEQTNPGVYYRYKYKVVPEKGGVLTMTCKATNAIFDDLKAEESKSITVQEPPSSLPVMTVNNSQPVPNGDVVTVTSGDNVVVKCQVNGGYPGVTKVTTTCAGKENVNNGETATQNIRMGKEDNNKGCVCQADHVTGCYDKKSELTLNVQYTATVEEYKANSESSELTVSADDTVTFVCRAEGNPKPDVSVQGQRSDEFDNTEDQPWGSYGITKTAKKKMSCKDTDIYSCVADNKIGDGTSSKAVTVFVKCVPELPSDFDTKEYTPMNGTTLNVIIPIIGYPEPKTYTLKKIPGNNRGRRRRAVSSEIVDDSMYNVSYVPGQPPEGKVYLNISGFTSKNSGQYVLTIDNGIGDGLDYTFNVSIAAEAVQTSEDTDYTPIIVAVVAVIVVIIIIILVIIILRKKGLPPFRAKTVNERQRIENEDEKIDMQDNCFYNGMETIGVRPIPKSSDPIYDREPDFVEHLNVLYVTSADPDVVAVRQAPQSSDPIYDRESDFVEHQNVLYGTSAEVTPDPDMAPVAYTDYSSIVPTITSATAKPRNYSGYSDTPMNENPYEDFTENVVSTGNPNASKSTAPPKRVLAKKPTPPSKPSVPKKGAPHQLDSVEETDMNDIYSAVVKSDPTPKPQRVVEDEAMDEDAYGFPLQKAAPSIPDKNFSDGGDDGVKKQKPAPANKKGLRLKIGNNKANTDEARKSQNAYNNVAMAQNETNGDVAADNVYGNIDKQADNVYGNVGVNGKAKSKENSKGKSKNNSALVYCNVEFIPPKEGSSRSNSKRFKIADDSVTYSSIHVESASKDGK